MYGEIASYSKLARGSGWIVKENQCVCTTIPQFDYIIHILWGRGPSVEQLSMLGNQVTMDTSMQCWGTKGNLKLEVFSAWAHFLV